MATVPTTVEVPDEILKEYEIVGVRRITKGELYLDIYAVSEWRGRDMSECRYIVLRKKFVWPEWLKAVAIAMDSGGGWWAYSKSPVPCGDCWSCKDQACCAFLNDIAGFIGIELPKLHPSQWQNSLIVNPNREGGK